MRFGTRSLYDKHTRQSAAKHQTQWPLFTPRIRSLIALRLTGVQGERDLTAVHKHKLPADLTIRITNPKGIIIMGRDPQPRVRKGRTIDPTLDLEVIKRRYANMMDILTYDDLLRRIDRIIESLQHRIIHNQ